jgi:hypothetical protein
MHTTADAVVAESSREMGMLRGAISRGEVVVFETIGAFQAISRNVVGAETPQEREEGGKTLDFERQSVRGAE